MTPVHLDWHEIQPSRQNRKPRRAALGDTTGKLRLGFRFQFAIQAQDFSVIEMRAMGGENRPEGTQNTRFPIDQRAVTIEGEDAKAGGIEHKKSATSRESN